MKVLVINEPFVPDFCRTQRWAARTRGRVLRAPDWLAYATAILEKEKFDVKLYDFPAAGWGKNELKNIVEKEIPDFVVLDSTTPSIYSDIECAKIVKDNSRAKVLMVGPHVSALPEETLSLAAGVVDVACIGEYDYTVRDVIKNFSALDTVAGIAYYEGGQVRVTIKRPLIEKLDELPFPAWHHLDLFKYFDGGKLYPYIDVISGRGCPNRCSFCLWPQVMHGLKYRLRSPKNVVDELEYDIKLCPQIKRGEFFFEDDTFTVDKERAILICEEILRRGLKITFSVNARADSADKEMFKIMKRAGCRLLLVGFESGVQEILNNVNKNIKLSHSLDFVKLAKEEKLQVHGCFVIGLPGETEDTAKKTVDFALSLGCDTLQFSGAVPFPGTEFFKTAEKEGWLKTRNWERWLGEGEQKGIVQYPGISEEKINYYVDAGLKKFYFRPSYMIKFLLGTHSLSDLYRKCRGAWNFISYILKKSVAGIKYILMLKILIIKIFARIVLLLGLLFRRARMIDSKEIKTILVNKADRLGDAAVTLPFLLELSKHFDITVLTSKYNDFILKDFLKTKIFIDSPLPFSEVIKMIAKSIFSFRPYGRPLKAPEYDLYLDLNGIKELNIFMDIKKRNLCRYYVDFNLGPWNLFLDYAAKGNSVLFSKKHILDSYRDLVKGSLGLDIDVPDYVELGPKGIMPQDFNIKEPYILVNISGFDKFRGPSPKFFAKVVDALNFKGKIVVMDDLGRPNLTHFRQAAQNNTVVYLDKDYSPWELLAIAEKSLLYIGSDSGISHLLQIPVSAALFFGNPPALVWRPYSKNEYTKSVEHKTIIEKTTTSHKLHKMIIYNQLWCGTCFDIGCRAKTCLEFDINFTVGEINKLIGQIKI